MGVVRCFVMVTDPHGGMVTGIVLQTGTGIHRQHVIFLYTSILSGFTWVFFLSFLFVFLHYTITASC